MTGKIQDIKKTQLIPTGTWNIDEKKLFMIEKKTQNLTNKILFYEMKKIIGIHINEHRDLYNGNSILITYKYWLQIYT